MAGLPGSGAGMTSVGTSVIGQRTQPRIDDADLVAVLAVDESA